MFNTQVRHDTVTERRQRIEFRIFALLNRADYATRISTYVKMHRAAQNRGDEAVLAMAQVERELRAVKA